MRRWKTGAEIVRRWRTGAEIVRRWKTGAETTTEDIGDNHGEDCEEVEDRRRDNNRGCAKFKTVRRNLDRMRRAGWDFGFP